MPPLHWVSSLHFEDWFLSLVIIGITLVSAEASRIVLKRLIHERKWYRFGHLGSSAANLIYVIGLRLLTDVAPLSPKLLGWFDSAVYVLAVLVILGILRRALMMSIEFGTLKSGKGDSLQQGFIPVLRNLVTLFIFLTGAIMVLKHFNYDVMSLITALGVGSLAVGLAAKDTLSNMISGFTLIIDRNLRPGDRINLIGSSGAVGRVDEIGLRSTRIRTDDGNTLIVPNNELVNTKLINFSMPTREAACSSTFRVPYRIPFEAVRSEAVGAISEVESADKTMPQGVVLANLADGYQAVTAYFWVRDLGDQGKALSDFNEKLLARLAAKQIPLQSI
jgi:small-conductance mechanosensitive channel